MVKAEKKEVVGLRDSTEKPVVATFLRSFLLVVLLR